MPQLHNLLQCILSVSSAYPNTKSYSCWAEAYRAESSILLLKCDVNYYTNIRKQSYNLLLTITFGVVASVWSWKLVLEQVMSLYTTHVVLEGDCWAEAWAPSLALCPTQEAGPRHGANYYASMFLECDCWWGQKIIAINKCASLVPRLHNLLWCQLLVSSAYSYTKSYN